MNLRLRELRESQGISVATMIELLAAACVQREQCVYVRFYV